MVMHCGVKRKHGYVSDETFTTLNSDLHQQLLLELSVQKLQEEQVKHSVEPRLLRFVLINNTIRILQTHIMAATQEEDDDMSNLFSTSSSDMFFSNTLTHGRLSSPPSPPSTPSKVPKLDSDHFSTDSLLSTNPCSFGAPCTSSTEISEQDSNVSGGTLMLEDCRPKDTTDRVTCSKGLDTRLVFPNVEGRRKRPHPLTIPVEDPLPHDDHLSSTTSSDLSPSPSSSSSLSPIDFAKVDVSLYDFDARTNLAFPQMVETSRPPSVPSGLTCSAQTFVPSAKIEHSEVSEQEYDEDDEDYEEEEDKSTNCSNDSVCGSSNGNHGDDGNHGNDGKPPSSSTIATASSSSSSSVASLSPEGFDNFDDSHEIDRIVSLLMA